MTISEAKDILVDRVGWKDDKTIDSFSLSANNVKSDSGRYFQEEHSAITLLNIRECQPVVNISGANFNTYLEGLKKQVVLQVLGDAIEKDNIHDDLLTKYPGGFDKAILLRMVLVVGELIITTSRSNRTTRFEDRFIGKLHTDIYREATNNQMPNSKYRHTLGIASRYDMELRSLQRRFGQQRNLLKTITKGQVYEQYPNGEFRD